MKVSREGLIWNLSDGLKLDAGQCEGIALMIEERLMGETGMPEELFTYFIEKRTSMLDGEPEYAVQAVSRRYVGKVTVIVRGKIKPL